MRKKNLRSFIYGAVCLSVSGFLFCAAAFVSGDLKKQTPAAIEVYDVQGLNVSMAQAFSFAEGDSFAAAGVGTRAQASDDAQSKTISAYYQMTTPNYGAYLNLQFCEGGYFSADGSKEPSAVIPESLSKMLFEEKSGEKILLVNGRKFKVCGVYKDGGALTQLGSASLPVIYGNAPERTDTPAESLLIKAEAGKTARQQRQETAVAMGIPLEGEMHDLGRLHQLGEALLLLGFFLAGLWFILRLCIISYQKLISAYECREPGTQRGPAAVWGVCAFLLAMTGFWLLLQLVRIPAVYLPENNIFDFAYYGSQITGGIQQINADGRVRDFSRICAVYLCAETGLLVLAVPLFWAGCRSLAGEVISTQGGVILWEQMRTRQKKTL